MWAVSHFHHLLYGNTVTILTDHTAVKAVLECPNPTAKHARWWSRVYGRGIKQASCAAEPVRRTRELTHYLVSHTLLLRKLGQLTERSRSLQSQHLTFSLTPTPTELQKSRSPQSPYPTFPLIDLTLRELPLVLGKVRPANLNPQGATPIPLHFLILTMGTREDSDPIWSTAQRV